MVIEKIDYSIKPVQFRKPFKTAKGIFTHRDVLEVTGTRSDGEVFTSEAVAFPEFAGPSIKECIRDLEIVKELLPFESESPFPIPNKIMNNHSLCGSVRAALEHIGMKAIQGPDSAGDEFNGIYKGYSVKVNALLSADTVDEALEKCDDLLKQGYTCIKLKVGAGNPSYEIEMISALRNTFGYDFLLRLDANAVWNEEEAVNFLVQCSDFNIEYIEQPVEDCNLFPQIKSKTGIPLAADESLRNFRDALAIARGKLADYFIIKPHFVGGFTQSSVIAEAGKQNGIGSVVSGCLETSPGRGLTVVTAFMLNNNLHHGLSLNNVYLNDDTSLYPVERGYITFDNLW